MSNSIRFLHMRNIAEEDVVLPNGGKTIAFTVSGHDPQGNRTLRFAVAKCGKKQAFNRKLGREVASGMLLCERPASIQKHVREIHINDDTHPYEALLAAVE